MISFCLIVCATTLKYSIWSWNLRTAFPLFKKILFIVPYIVVPISDPQEYICIWLSSWIQMRLIMGQMCLLMSAYVIGVSCHRCITLSLAQRNDEVLFCPGTWSLLVKRSAPGSHPKLHCLQSFVNFVSFTSSFHRAQLPLLFPLAQSLSLFSLEYMLHPIPTGSKSSPSSLSF